jgi:hypothetical protein
MVISVLSAQLYECESGLTSQTTEHIYLDQWLGTKMQKRCQKTN